MCNSTRQNECTGLTHAGITSTREVTIKSVFEAEHAHSFCRGVGHVRVKRKVRPRGARLAEVCNYHDIKYVLLKA